MLHFPHALIIPDNKVCQFGVFSPTTHALKI